MAATEAARMFHDDPTLFTVKVDYGYGECELDLSDMTTDRYK